MGITDETIISICRRWIKRFVIGENLCPFAGAVEQRIRIKVTRETSINGLAPVLLSELNDLTLSEPDELPTTLLVLGAGWHSFSKYLEAADLAESLIDEAGLSDDLQLATFHPEYVFDGVEDDDVGNFTNRSPFPLLHLLRAADVAHAIETYPDVELIPERNIQRMEELGRDRLHKALASHSTPGEIQRDSSPSTIEKLKSH